MAAQAKAQKKKKKKPAATGSKSGGAKKPTQKAPQSAALAAAQNRNQKALQGAALAAAQHRNRMLRAYAFGVATLLVLLLAVVPGENMWGAAHNGLWGLGGMTLLPWLAFAFYCESLWLRNRTLGSAWLSLLCQGLFIFAFGVSVFLFAHTAEALAQQSWQELAKSNLELEILCNGGFLSAALGALLAKACGKTGALFLSLLCMAASAPMALPRVRASIAARITARWGQEKNQADDVPQTIPAKSQKTQPVAAQTPELDELAALDEIARAATSKNRFFGGHKPAKEPAQDESAVPATTIATVADFAPTPPLEPIPAKTPRRKEKEDDAVRAAMDALLKDAAAEAPGAYQPPPLNCLNAPRTAGDRPEQGEVEMISNKLVRTLDSFGVKVDMVGYSRGPAVTRYELRPHEGVKISKITSLSDDIALRLAATKVRIEAPIPGKPAVGVEIPNRVRAVVSLRELVESGNYRTGTQKSKLTVALGKDIVGDFVCADLAKLPHLLIAGTTGSGKSVCMNTLIMSLIFNASPEDVKLIMVDPKQVEFNIYSGIPHLLVPVVSDPLKAAGALGWAVSEMERRYGKISEQNVRDQDSYNNIAAMQEDLEHMPKIVIFIDELSDLMMAAPSDVEDSIQRIAQKGRAAGMHLVVATQRPSVDVITGVIKSNLPGRIALSVASQIDSRTIINSAGAEQLLGNGDMLFSINGGNNAVRVQGCFVSDPEVQKVVNFVKRGKGDTSDYDSGVWEEIERNAANAARGKKKGGMLDVDTGEDDDPMLDAAIEVVVAAQMASTTMLQKKLKLGYARASRVVDLLEARGIVGPPDGSKPRKVLMSPAQWMEYSAGSGNAEDPQ